MGASPRNYAGHPASFFKKCKYKKFDHHASPALPRRREPQSRRPPQQQNILLPTQTGGKAGSSDQTKQRERPRRAGHGCRRDHHHHRHNHPSLPWPLLLLRRRRQAAAGGAAGSSGQEGSGGGAAVGGGVAAGGESGGVCGRAAQGGTRTTTVLGAVNVAEAASANSAVPGVAAAGLHNYVAGAAQLRRRLPGEEKAEAKSSGATGCGQRTTRRGIPSSSFVSRDCELAVARRQLVQIDAAAQQESAAAGPRSCSSDRRSLLSRLPFATAQSSFCHRPPRAAPQPPPRADGCRPPCFSPPSPSPRALAGLPALLLPCRALLPAVQRPPPFSLSARLKRGEERREGRSGEEEEEE